MTQALPSTSVPTTPQNPLSIGQHGSTEAGTPLPGPGDPAYVLATLGGMLAGDHYDVTQQMPDVSDQALSALTMDSYARSFGESQFDSAKVPTVTGPTQGGQGVLGAANKYLGIKYVYGGTDPNTGLDCSGFVQRVYSDMGVALPRVTYDQVKAGTPISNSSQLRPGDLIFFWGDGGRMNGHVGIYAGGDQMINSPHTGATVRYDKINWGQVTAMRRVLS